MKAKDIALYIAIGLGGLAIISIFVPIVRRLTSIANMRNLTLAGLTFHGY